MGIESFEERAHTVLASADDLPFPDNSFDVAIMDAVWEHLPNAEASFAEVARVLRPGGLLVGYVALMECFHEISYFHLSFKALEHLAKENEMALEAISVGGSLGIDYHTAVLFYQIRFFLARKLIAASIRGFIRLYSFAVLVLRLLAKRDSSATGADWTKRYFQLECLRQSNGFQFIIRKSNTDLITHLAQPF